MFRFYSGFSLAVGLLLLGSLLYGAEGRNEFTSPLLIQTSAYEALHRLEAGALNLSYEFRASQAQVTGVPIQPTEYHASHPQVAGALIGPSRYLAPNQQEDSVTVEPHPAKPLIYSLVLPGAGQYYNRSPRWKMLLFAGLEVGLLSSYWAWNSRADEVLRNYETFADEHWGLSRWYQNTIRLFPDQWEQILVGTHKLDLIVEDTYFTTDRLDSLQRVYSWEQIEVLRDRDFYENIGKYDQFVGGWDDTWDEPRDSSGNWYLVQKGSRGETVLMTRRKDRYRSMRFDRNRLLDRTGYVITMLMFNHVISSLEAVWSSQRGRGRFPQAALLIDSRYPYRIGGITLTWSW